MPFTPKVTLYFIFLLWATSCSEKKVSEKHSNTESGTCIAFMSDVHLLDVHGTLKDIDYGGIKNPKTDEFALIRTMDAQLHSTRLFNENYFAFRAALDDAVQRGIKLIALPGDFSDDGQPLNVRGLNLILDEYSEKYGISFFLTTGNHDPQRPFDTKAGKADFLGEGGKAQPIMSEEGMYVSNLKKEHPTLISEDIRGLGYDGIVNGLQNHGFFPKKNIYIGKLLFPNTNTKIIPSKKRKKLSISKIEIIPLRAAIWLYPMSVIW